MYIFYPDVYFFSQLVTAIYAIAMVTCVFSSNIKKKRMVVVGIGFGLVSTVLVILIHPFVLYSAIMHMILIPMTIYAVMRHSTIKELIRDVITSYVAIWMLYGCMEWLTLQTGWSGTVLLCICSVFLYVIVFFVNKIRIRRNHQIPVILCHKGKKMSMTAYCDTGNVLTDPYCGKPVHVISKECLTPFLEETQEKNYRYIPYETVSGKEMMMGYTFDELILCKKQPIVLKKVVIGMSKNELFRGKSIQLLLNVSQLNL